MTRQCVEAKSIIKIEGNAGNQKALYQVTNHLLGKLKQKSPPDIRFHRLLQLTLSWSSKKINRIRKFFSGT